MTETNDKPEQKKKRKKKYEKPSMESARFSEKKALACAKQDTQAVYGCASGFFS